MLTSILISLVIALTTINVLKIDIKASILKVVDIVKQKILLIQLNKAINNLETEAALVKDKATSILPKVAIALGVIILSLSTIANVVMFKEIVIDKNIIYIVKNK